MRYLWKVAASTLSLLMFVGLVFSSGVFSLILYGKVTGRDWTFSPEVEAHAEKAPEPSSVPPSPPPKVKKASAFLKAPVIRQYPELPSGCEVTSLAMLLQFKGIDKGKMELVPELKRDTTELKYGPDGSIVYWGNPNIGFVGEITGKAKGFGIYHTALIELLKSYIPEAVDLTNRPFAEVEMQISDGFPVVVWTTFDFAVPTKWVEWDSPIGPFRATFAEHAVLLVGYDEHNVYVNDPLSGKSGMAINKDQFLQTWDALGKQAISYRN